MSDRGSPSERTGGTPDADPASRLAAEQLAESTRRFNSLLDHLGMLALLADSQRRLTYVNPALLALTGYRSEDLVGKDAFAVFVPPEAIPALEQTHEDILEDRPGGWNSELEILTRQGERRYTRWSNTVLRNAAGDPVGSAHIGEDVTDKREAERVIAESEARYRKLFDASPLPMWVYDRETLAFLAVNDAAVARYGWTREQFLSMSIRDIRPPDDRPRLEELVEGDRRERATGATAPFVHAGTWQHCTRDGTRIDVEIRAHGLDFDGRPAVLVVANDVTLRFEQERKIARLSRIRAVIGGISSVMLRARDRRELLSEACRVASTEGVFPMAWATEIGPDGSLTIVASYGPDPHGIEFIQATIRGAIPIEQRPTTHVARSGRPYVVNDIAAEAALAPIRADLERRGYGSGAAFPLFLEGRVVASLVLLSRDKGFFDEEEITLLEWLTADLSFALEHVEKSRRLDYLAYYDALTGSANARLFADRLEQFVHGARASQGEVVVVVFDLEHFTRVNDTLGRAFGDELLRLVARRFEERLVEPYAFGRIGGDTFALASPRDPGHAATRLGDCVFELLREPFALADRSIAIGAQAGVALYPFDGPDAPTVFQNAESALMLAKANGESSTYFSVEMNARLAKRRALEDALRLAVERGQLVLHYQPRVDLSNGALVGAEALVRWQDPARGLVPPVEFIGLAEETGLIVPIGNWVLEAVCAQQASWQAAGLGVVPVAINLSPVQFESGDLLMTVHEALARHGLDPSLLEVELTESSVMKDPAAAATTLRALRALGVGLAIDDFGTGYSSLAHLKRFPFDAVKIDRSFVTEITANPEDAAIATAIIAMAHRLGLRVVAEGVETEAQLSYLRAESCDEMQGNYFSAAVAREAFEKILRNGRRMKLPARPEAGERTLLVVDNEAGVRSALTRALRRDGYRILTADTGREALELLATNAVQVIISDQRMPEMSGTEFLSIVRQLYPDTVRIILSGYTELEVVTDAVNRGAVFKFLTKPWDDELLREQVRDAFRRYRPERRRAG